MWNVNMVERQENVSENFTCEVDACLSFPPLLAPCLDQEEFYSENNFLQRRGHIPIVRYVCQ